jgi:hypothetical protein
MITMPYGRDTMYELARQYEDIALLNEAEGFGSIWAPPPEPEPCSIYAPGPAAAPRRIPFGSSSGALVIDGVPTNEALLTKQANPTSDGIRAVGLDPGLIAWLKGETESPLMRSFPSGRITFGEGSGSLSTGWNIPVSVDWAAGEGLTPDWHAYQNAQPETKVRLK